MEWILSPCGTTINRFDPSDLRLVNGYSYIRVRDSRDRKGPHIYRSRNMRLNETDRRYPVSLASSTRDTISKVRYV